MRRNGWQLIRAVFQRDRLNREMYAEMRDHLERATELLVARGMSRADAMHAARREFGNVANLKEEGRMARGAMWVESALADFRYAFRGLRKNPVFTVVAVASLAIGIGANTAIFGLINAVILRSLPVDRPEELVQLRIFDAKESVQSAKGGSTFTNPLWEATRDQVKGFSGFAAAGSAAFDLADGGEARPATGSWVNGDYFNTLGVRPALGRVFTRADDVRGCAPTVVLSYAFWQSEFGGRADILDTPLRMSNTPYTIIGVSAPGFSGIEVGIDREFFVPICAIGNERLDARSEWWLHVIGRPVTGASLAQANAQLEVASRGIFEATISPKWEAKRRAEYASRHLGARSAATGLSAVRTEYSSALLTLMGMVGAILLIACANVANLLLARGTTRTRETAIRLAIGASRARLVRQNLTEGIVLAAMGTAVGILIAHWGSRMLVALLDSGAPDAHVALDLSVDLRILTFTSLVGVLTVIMFALVPAWRSARVSPQSAMKSGGRGMGEGHSQFTLGKGLVAAQCALALILIVGAGLLLGSFTRLASVDPGFRAEGVIIASVDMSRVHVEPAAYRDMQMRLLDELRAQPGLADASASNLTPISGSGWDEDVLADGVDTKEGGRDVFFNRVSDGFLRTMGTPLVAGRDFDKSDVIDGPISAIVNRATAKRYFGNGPALGRVIRTFDQGKLGPPMTIVGVMGDSKYWNLREESGPTVFVAASQDSLNGATAEYEIRVKQAPGSAINEIKAVAARTDSRYSLHFNTLSAQLERSVMRERMLASLSVLFGVTALLLAMIGLYGVMAYMVNRRRVEIGIRVALGAARSRIMSLVLGDVLRMIAGGIVVGGVGAFLLSRLLKSFLYGVTENDPRTLIAAILLLALSGLLAGAIPAQRAASMEPLEALRED